MNCCNVWHPQTRHDTKFQELQVVKATRALSAEGDDAAVPEGCNGTVLDLLRNKQGHRGYIVDFVDDEGETVALRCVVEEDLASAE